MVGPDSGNPAAGTDAAESLRVQRDGPVTLATIDRPARRNAVDLTTLVALRELATSVATDGTRVLVLTGAPPAFSAGADLTGVDAGEFDGALAAALHAVADLPLPVIAAVDGPALGAGLQLTAACDLRVATPSSRFGIPAARLGLAVDQWTVARVAREFTPAIARSMLLTAESYGADQLHAAGVVHRLGGLDDAWAWARQLAALAPLTIAAHKLAFAADALAAAGHDIAAAEAQHRAADARERAWASRDAQEGRQAFIEKRAPVFEGR